MEPIEFETTLFGDLKVIVNASVDLESGREYPVVIDDITTFDGTNIDVSNLYIKYYRGIYYTTGVTVTSKPYIDISIIDILEEKAWDEYTERKSNGEK